MTRGRGGGGVHPEELDFLGKPCISGPLYHFSVFSGGGGGKIKRFTKIYLRLEYIAK